MVNKRTAIGIGVGATITAIGFYALVTSFGLQSVQVDDTLGIGEPTTYSFSAPDHAKQYMEITGDSFHLKLRSPKGGLDIPGKDYKNELSLEWVHLQDGQSTLEIQNTGNSELHLVGTFEVLSDPIEITYHILVITAGIIIIGFSATFSIRKPRGF